MDEEALKELDNLIDWIAHSGGWPTKPINKLQYDERVATLNKKTKKIRKALTDASVVSPPS